MKKAFTMLELVFVIVVIGILAATIIPSIKTNPLREAAIQLVSHIKYTQHLAMVDDKYGDNTTGLDWYKKRWQIVFSTSDNNADNKPAYLIFRDSDADGTVDKSELAHDNIDISKYLTGGLTGYSTLNINSLSNFDGTSSLNLGKKYGITNITLSSTCSTGTKVAFDHLGRPIKGPLSSYSSPYPSTKPIIAACKIMLFNGDGNITIEIEKETGYTRIN